MKWTLLSLLVGISAALYCQEIPDCAKYIKSEVDVYAPDIREMLAPVEIHSTNGIGITLKIAGSIEYAAINIILLDTSRSLDLNAPVTFAFEDNETIDYLRMPGENRNSALLLLTDADLPWENEPALLLKFKKTKIREISFRSGPETIHLILDAASKDSIFYSAGCMFK